MRKSNLDHFPKDRGEHQKYVNGHHLGFYWGCGIGWATSFLMGGFFFNDHLQQWTPPKAHASRDSGLGWDLWVAGGHTWWRKW